MIILCLKHSIPENSDFFQILRSEITIFRFRGGKPPKMAKFENFF